MNHGNDCGCPLCMEHGGERSWERTMPGEKAPAPAKASPSSLTLKPCPFCGAVPDYDSADSFTGREGTGFAKWGAVQCGCGVIGSDVRTDYKPFEHWREAAALEWNKRMPGEKAPAPAEGAEDYHDMHAELLIQKLSAIRDCARDMDCRNPPDDGSDDPCSSDDCLKCYLLSLTDNGAPSAPPRDSRAGYATGVAALGSADASNMGILRRGDNSHRTRQVGRLSRQAPGRTPTTHPAANHWCGESLQRRNVGPGAIQLQGSRGCALARTGSGGLNAQVRHRTH
jgi:hypothetical protein